MRRLLPILLLLLVSCGIPAHATLSLVQHVSRINQSCSPSCTSWTLATNPTAGHLGIIAVNGDFAGGTISSVSGGGTWSVSHTSPACQGSDTAGISFTDVAYSLSLTGGSTSITITLSGTSGAVDMEFFEYSSTATPFIFDTCGGRNVTTAGANLAGVTLTLSGSSDVIVQTARFSATGQTSCGSGWTSPNDAPNGDGMCGKINTASGTANTYTNSSQTASESAIAIKESGGASSVCSNFISLMGAGCQ